MKRYSLFQIFLLFCTLLNAQSLSLFYESSPVSNNSYIYITGNESTSELVVPLTFTNNGSEFIDVCVKKAEIQLVPGTENTFAFGGLLFPPFTYQSPIQVGLEVGESSSEFSGYYMPYNNPGESIIKYTFFDYNNSADSICVNVLFLIEDDDPLLTDVDPDFASIPELLTVEISGSNTHFTMGTGTTVWFNQGSSTIYPMSVNEVNNTLLEAEFLFSNMKIPGLYDVHTHNNYDGHLVLPGAFTLYPNPNPPVLVSISPSFAYAGEMVTVTIIAENTNFTQGVNYAYLYNDYTYLWDNLITVISDEIIIVEFPITSGCPTGFYDLWVKSVWDGPISLNDAFMIFPDSNPPYLTEIDPDQGTIPETLTVTISGTGTHFNQATGTIVKLKQASSTIYSYNVVELNEEELLATFTFDDFDNPGFYDVNTYNALDGDLYLYNAFYLNPNPNPPQLISIDPDSAQPGENLEVSISGQNTNFTQGTGTTVWLNMGNNFIYPYSTTTVSDELVNASFLINNNETLGSYDVNTHNWANGNLVLEDGFTIYEEIPYLSYIDPFSGYLGESISLSIFGENTHFLDAISYDAWLFKENLVIYPIAINAISNLEIVADIVIPEDADPGSWTVFATNSDDGDMYIENAFEIIDTTTSIQYNQLFKSIEIYPNPTKGKIFISFELNNSDYVTLQLCDFYGNTLYKKTFNENKMKQKELLIPTLASGVYYLKFSSDFSFVTKKVIVK